MLRRLKYVALLLLSAAVSPALEPGEQLTFISDGVVEAASGTGEFLGFDLTRSLSVKPAQEIAEAAKAWRQNDDITVVTVRRRK
jgi:serine phosphatase RsbU (regulator of sigma subunit)